MSSVVVDQGLWTPDVPPSGASPTPSTEVVARLVRRRRRRRVQVWAARIVLLGVVIGLWQLVSGRMFPTFVVSSPSQVVAQGWHWLRNGYLLSNLGVTMEETAVGFASGALVGLAGGVILGIVTVASDVLSPYINAAYALPKIMLAPLLVVWFGIALEMKAILSGLFVVFIVFYNVWSGVREVDRDLVETLAMMGAGRWQMTKALYLPSALSWLFTSLRIAFPVSLIGAIVGEFVAANAGVGFVVTKSAALFNAAGVYVGIIAVTLVAVAVDGIIVFAQRKLASRQGAQGAGRLVI